MEFDRLMVAKLKAHCGGTLPGNANVQNKIGLSDVTDGCMVKELTPLQLQCLLSLSEEITQKVSWLVPWGDGFGDRKRRCYGILDDLGWSTKKIEDAGIILQEEQATCMTKHERTISQSFCCVKATAEQLDALNAVIALVQKGIRLSNWKLDQCEREAICLENLITVQPNLHCREPFLPLHVDSPRHDGFGIVIVTIALVGAADIIILDDGDEGTDAKESWCFPLHPGQFYTLCGYARNLCCHGVVLSDATESTDQTSNDYISTIATITTNTCDAAEHEKVAGQRRHKRRRTTGHSRSFPDRQSLNLRFGIHTEQQARELIDQHWGN